MRRVTLWLAALALAGLVAAAVWVRLAPVEPERWHVDPLAAEAPRTPNFHLLRPPEAPVWAIAPETLATAVAAAAAATPRTRLIAGGAAEGWMTFLTRSRLVGFPDYTSVRVLPAEGGATLAVFARSRFGRSDLGVNKARVEGWLARLPPAVSPGP